MTDIQALVLGIRKECSWRKLAAGDTTVGSTPTTRIYDRSADRVTLQEIERVQIGKKQPDLNFRAQP